MIDRRVTPGSRHGRWPKGEFGAPQAVQPTTARNLAPITLGVATFFPLAGASLIITAALDAIGSRLIGRYQTNA